MVRDPRELLLEAAPQVDSEPDLDAIERRVRRRRAVRVSALAAAIVLVTIAVAGAATGLLDDDDPPVIDQPPEEAAVAEGWPVLARYEEIRYDDGRTYDWELAAERWDAWTMVRTHSFNLDEAGEPVDPSPDGLGLARDGDQRWAGTSHFLDEADREGPFDLVEELAAGLWSDQYALGDHPDGEDIWIPLEAFTDAPAAPDDVPADALAAPDLPTVRIEVAERLGLDPDKLVAFAVEREDGVHVIWVRDGTSGLPLLYREAIGEPRETDEGLAVDPARVTLSIEATDVRFEAALPTLRPDVPPDEAADPAEPGVGAAGDWRELPRATVDGRQLAGAVWTGDELIVWGGVPRTAGAAYDPATDTWRDLPDPPVDAREHHVAVWTGSELIVWGGAAYDEPDDPDAPMQADAPAFRDDGAAYDPDTDTWRALADGPLEARAGPAAAWTGSEVVIVAGTGAGHDPGTTETFTDSAAYDPATDTWRDLPDLPNSDLREVGPHAVWTGSEVLVAGSRFAPGQATAYDPTQDAWRHIDGGPLGGAGSVVAWTGSRAIVTDTMTGALAAYAPDTDEWFDLASPPVDALQAVSFVATDDRLLAVGDAPDDTDTPMGAWMLDPAGQNWTALGDPPIAARSRPAAVWTGDEILIWSGGAIGVGDEIAAHDDGAAWRPDQ